MKTMVEKTNHAHSHEGDDQHQDENWQNHSLEWDWPNLGLSYETIGWSRPWDWLISALRSVGLGLRLGRGLQGPWLPWPWALPGAQPKQPRPACELASVSPWARARVPQPGLEPPAGWALQRELAWGAKGAAVAAIFSVERMKTALTGCLHLGLGRPSNLGLPFFF